MLEAWLKRITEELDAYNQANPDTPGSPLRRQPDRPSLQRPPRARPRNLRQVAGADHDHLARRREEVNQAAHSYGGITLHDVINNRFAKKAIEKGADGLIAVAAGAGGHAGALSPFALIQEIRAWFDGPLLLSGCDRQRQLRSLRPRPWAPTSPTSVPPSSRPTRPTPHAEYKQMLVDGAADDIVYTNLFTGVHGNYLKPAIARAGMDPDNFQSRRREDGFLVRCLEAEELEGNLGLRPGHCRRQRSRASR